MYPEMAAAGLWTTATDRARYALAVQSKESWQARDTLATDGSHDAYTGNEVTVWAYSSHPAASASVTKALMKGFNPV
jgi:hypothetical protein